VALIPLGKWLAALAEWRSPAPIAPRCRLAARPRVQAILAIMMLIAVLITPRWDCRWWLRIIVMRMAQGPVATLGCDAARLFRARRRGIFDRDGASPRRLGFRWSRLIPSPITNYDVVVVGAGGSGLRATLGMTAAGRKTLHQQGLSDAQPHGGGARRQSAPRSAKQGADIDCGVATVGTCTIR